MHRKIKEGSCTEAAPRLPLRLGGRGHSAGSFLNVKTLGAGYRGLREQKRGAEGIEALHSTTIKSGNDEPFREHKTK